MKKKIHLVLWMAFHGFVKGMRKSPDVHLRELAEGGNEKAQIGCDIFEIPYRRKM